MGKLQKLIIMFYAFSVFFLSFVYVPYTQFHQGGAKSFLGHHLRATIANLMGIQWKFSMRDTFGTMLFVSIDAQIIVAEVIALTVITVAAVIVLKRK